MNHNQTALKLQKKLISKNIKTRYSTYWSNLLYKQNLDSIIEDYSINNRNRIYTHKQTLSMFLTQSLNKDSSCQKIVNNVAFTQTSCSVSTGAYCKARKRLDEIMIIDMCKSLALKNEKRVKNNWKFRGKNIYLVDGTTITMPDTIYNQEKYPQSTTQKNGLGFPICRIVGIISLATGSIIDVAVSPYSGKGSAEQALLRSMLNNFKKGDIILADAIYSTYSLITYLIEKGIDIVFVQNGARSKKTDFTKGKYLGKDDHLITIKKPTVKPEWMDENIFQNKPKEFIIRELKVGDKILITTMLCSKKVSSKTIKNLYKQRWNIEVDFRNIKSTLGLISFSCKTPQMVMKEMWIYFLAYNMIRTIMLDSAIYNKIFPRQISFKHTLQLIESYILLKTNFNISIYKYLLYLVGKKIVGNRKGRIEPRALKRRPNKMPLLMKPREIAREEIRKHGHPKKA